MEFSSAVVRIRDAYFGGNVVGIRDAYYSSAVVSFKDACHLGFRNTVVRSTIGALVTPWLGVPLGL